MDATVDVNPAGHLVLAGSEFITDSMSVQGIVVPNDPTDQNEAIVMCMDLGGNVQWVRCFGASNAMLERTRGVAVGNDGRVYVATGSDTLFTFAGAGLPAISGYDGHIGCLLAYDGNGNEDWVIPAYSHYSSVTFWDVMVDAGGNVVSTADLISGGSMNGITVPVIARPYTVMKTDIAGNLIWLKHPMAGSTTMSCPVFDLGQGPDGAYYAGGFGKWYDLDCEDLGVIPSWTYYVMRIVEEPVIVPMAGFTWMANGLDVQFMDGSSNASSWSWDLSDGTGATVHHRRTAIRITARIT